MNNPSRRLVCLHELPSSMKPSFLSSLRVSGLSAVCLALFASLLPSCIAPPPPPRRVVAEPEAGPAPIEVLPPGGRYVVLRGERVWLHRGVYYRRHPGGRGWVVFRP